jgi:sporulation protein YlmC with PRC-barrel domain
MGKFQPLRAIQNRDIVDSSGELVGCIHDMLFNVQDGRIEYVCIAVSGATDSDMCEVVVPWSVLRPGRGGSRWAIASTKRVLQGLAQPVSRRK